MATLATVKWESRAPRRGRTALEKRGAIPHLHMNMLYVYGTVPVRYGRRVAAGAAEWTSPAAEGGRRLPRVRLPRPASVKTNTADAAADAPRGFLRLVAAAGGG